MKICLCGSTRFRADWEKMNELLSKAGNTVYSVSCFLREGESLTQDEKETLDLVHLNKILGSDAVVVVGEQNGRPYIGDSTRREIKWAKMHNKLVIYQYQIVLDEMSFTYLIDPMTVEGR